MKYPNFKEEKKLWKQGYKFVVGLDESGRGPLAGPVTAVAVTVRQFSIFNDQFSRIRDSKKLSEKQREFFYEKLTNHSQIKWGVGLVSEKVIDKINILEATKLAMNKALNNLLQKTDDRRFFAGGCHLIIDGNFKIHPTKYHQVLPLPEAKVFNRVKSNIRQKSIVAADQKVFSCTAASIIAKVTRDRIMQKMHKKYPIYGFNNHKGYGTYMHIKNLKTFGPCKIHRKTFEPIKSLAKTQII